MLQAVEREPTPQLPETKSVNEKNLNNSLNVDKSATSNLIVIILITKFILKRNLKFILKIIVE
jgi:hypothetical protein